MKDQAAQALLWEYAQRRRSVDAEFADDLEFALREAGYAPGEPSVVPKEHLDYTRSVLEVARKRIRELEAHAASVHKLLGRGSHGDAVADFDCALTGLLDVLQASRENSDENARLELDLSALRAENLKALAAIPMRLVCPECGTLHVDEGEFATKVHHTHSCQACGLTWRPAVVATVGVRFLPGFKNQLPPPAETSRCKWRDAGGCDDPECPEHGSVQPAGTGEKR